MAVRRLAVLRAVLSQTKDVIRDTLGVSDAEAMGRIEHYVRENARKWREEDPEINYSDPFCRLAYLYRNVPVHAALVERSLRQFGEITALLGDHLKSGEPLRVAVLGGGPGSELVGLVRYVESLGVGGDPLVIDMVLLDRIREWDESWHALKEGIDGQLKDLYGRSPARWPVIVSRSFLPLDLTDPKQFASFATRFAHVELVFVCYAVSELLGKINEVQGVLQTVLNRVAAGALVLFIDRDEGAVRSAVRTLIAQMGSLRLLSEHRETGQLDDDVREFGEWYMGMESLPRRTWRAFFTLAEKAI